MLINIVDYTCLQLFNLINYFVSTKGVLTDAESGNKLDFFRLYTFLKILYIMGIINTFKTTLDNINGATWINNVKIEGAQSISINNGKVYVDGKLRKDLSEPSIEIKIEGTVTSVHTGSGNVSVTGDVTAISTSSGDVNCQDVKGGVQTMSGDVTCNTIAGNVNTMSGDVYHN